MQVIDTIAELQKIISSSSDKNTSVGFVPTMGALHEGHLSLVHQSKKENDLTVVSIFVNPTQFNDIKDLEKYPRTVEKDISLLDDAGVDVVFTPAVAEVYPEPDTRKFNFGKLEQVMEGEFRPGHFNGVAQVVSKLFDMVKPNKAYFGEKDFQQLAIIRDMVKQYNIPVEIISVPIKREVSGLAMSSRNQRLSDEQTIVATNIYKVLNESKSFIETKSVEDTISYVVDKLNAINGLSVEYFEIVDGDSLQSVEKWTDADYIVGCITVFCGEVRLIDNITYKN